MASQLAEFSLLERKGSLIAGDSARKGGRSQTGSMSESEIPRCVYCGKTGYDEKRCWKKDWEGRLEKSCSYCGKRGHDESDFWIKKRREEVEKTGKIQGSNVSVIE